MQEVNTKNQPDESWNEIYFQAKTNSKDTPTQESSKYSFHQQEDEVQSRSNTDVQQQFQESLAKYVNQK